MQANQVTFLFNDDRTRFSPVDLSTLLRKQLRRTKPRPQLVKNIYALGRDYEQMGVPEPTSRIFLNRIDTTPFDSPVVQVASGDFHTVFLTESGKVYGCGKNTNLGIASGNFETPTLLPTLSHLVITKLACAIGCHHSLALTNNGRVVTFGTSTSDSICLLENHPDNCGCTELEITNHVIDPIVDIFTGGDCDSLNVVTSASEKIFIWGSDQYCGYKRPTLFEFQPIQKAAIGAFNFLLLTKHNVVYRMGKRTNNSPLMDRVSELGDVQDILYGGCYYIALTKTKVLLAGSPEDGGDSNTNIFRELIFGSRISRMSCGWHHAMFIDTNGVVYFLGDNYSMFLCEDETESSVPKVMDVGFTPFDVVCGSYCTFLLE